MKKTKTKTQKNNINGKHYNKIDYGEITLDHVNLSDKAIIESQMRDIDTKIEEIGKICDVKKQRSFDDYNNVLKANKAQFLDELTQLNFKLMETLKHNTREDLMNKLKKDLNIIKNQVTEKDKELHSKIH